MEKEEKKLCAFIKRHVRISLASMLVAGLVLGYGAASMGQSGSAARGSFAAQGGAFTRGGMMRGNQANGNFLAGTIAKTDSGSLTLDTRDGSSRVVLLTPETVVSKSVTGSTTDLSVGSNVIISGTTNGDGSVSAALVQLRPAGLPGTAMPQPQ